MSRGFLARGRFTADKFERSLSTTTKVVVGIQWATTTTVVVGIERVTTTTVVVGIKWVKVRVSMGTCVPNLGAIRRPVRKFCLSNL